MNEFTGCGKLKKSLATRTEQAQNNTTGYETVPAVNLCVFITFKLLPLIGN